MPTEAELETLVDQEVRSEVYYREARALGLDQNDAVVRGRLRQKMEFLMDTGAGLRKPADDELEHFYAANEVRYRDYPRLAFEQVYLGENPAPGAAEEALDTLRSAPDADPAGLGQRSLLPAELGLALPKDVDGTFGTGFFARLADLPVGSWVGPVASSFGMHLVRVRENRPARSLPFAEVRSAVLKDWRKTKADAIRERDYAKRREHYTVRIERGGRQMAENR